MNGKALTYPIYETGLRSKTINVIAEAGSNKFLLQKINELGLPFDSVIVGLWARESEATAISSSGLLLVDFSVQQTAYLSLKDRANKFNNINLLTSNYNLINLTEKAFFMQPVPSALIDWNQSYIEISGQFPASNNTVFELVVLYTERILKKPFPNRFCFRNGEKQAGIRVSYFEINLNTVQNLYSFGNTNNIGLEDNAIILGIRTVQNVYPLSKKDVMTIQAIRSSYITLKRGTDSFIENLPIELNQYNQLFPDYNYFPMQPMDVTDLDWQSSGLNVKDLTTITNNTVFQFELIWYSTSA